MGRVQGKIALVTGAGRGIGAECARLLAEEGATVYLSDRDDGPGEEAAAEVCEAGGDAYFVHLDVTREEDWERVVAEIRDEHGRIDILVNNAGLYFIASMSESSLECAREIFDTNVFGTFLGMKHVAPLMVSAGAGSIINMSSMDSISGAAGFTVYGGSKGAISTMTRDAAMEFADAQVRVNSVHPGYIRTRMAEYGARKEDTDLEGLAEQFPLGCIGEPIDVAYGVLYLASDEARWVTGSQLRIDGGATAE